MNLRFIMTTLQGIAIFLCCFGVISSLRAQESSPYGVSLGAVTRDSVLTPIAIRSAGNAGIVVDFANRSDSTHPIPAHFFGSGFGIFGSYQDYAWNLLKQAGIMNVRFDANIPQVFQTTSPNWSKIDSIVSYVARMGLEPIIIMDYTPPWLQPPTSPCDSVNPIFNVPTNISKWADIAAQYVHHGFSFSGSGEEL